MNTSITHINKIAKRRVRNKHLPEKEDSMKKRIATTTRAKQKGDRMPKTNYASVAGVFIPFRVLPVLLGQRTMLRCSNIGKTHGRGSIDRIQRAVLFIEDIPETTRLDVKELAERQGLMNDDSLWRLHLPRCAPFLLAELETMMTVSKTKSV
jgi:hypothetical protein